MPLGKPADSAILRFPMPDTPPPPAPRLAVLDALRGLAALWVALFHFTQNGRFNQGFPADQPLKWLATYGYLGVYCFFVISGFILPWTMARSRYRLRDFPRFLAKRALRLHPLYLLSVAAMLAPLLFQQATSLEAHTWSDWWPHFFYLNGLLGRPWLMQIYWTLALEAQYYLAIGLLFPLLAHRRPFARWAALAALATLPLWAHDQQTVLPFAALFAMGLLVFWRLRALASPLACALALLTCALITRQALGTLPALVALLTAAAILGPPLHHPWLVWLGSISYPFYLFHLVVAGLFMPLLIRMPRGPWQDGAAVLALLALSLALSALLHRALELPAQRWSSAIRYRPPQAPNPLPSPKK